MQIPDCANFSEAGTIQGAEATCFQSFLPTIIHNVSTPTTDLGLLLFINGNKVLIMAKLGSILIGQQLFLIFRLLLLKQLCIDDWLEKILAMIGWHPT